MRWEVIYILSTFKFGIGIVIVTALLFEF